MAPCKMYEEVEEDEEEVVQLEEFKTGLMCAFASLPFFCITIIIPFYLPPRITL